MTRKIFIFLLAAMLVFSFAACGKKEPEKTEEPNTPTAPAETPGLQGEDFAYTLTEYPSIKFSREGAYNLHVINAYKDCEALYAQFTQDAIAAVAALMDDIAENTDDNRVLPQTKELLLPQIIERYEEFAHALAPYDNREYWENNSLILVELSDGDHNPTIKANYDEETGKLALTIKKSNLNMGIQKEKVYVIGVNRDVQADDVTVEIV